MNSEFIHTNFTYWFSPAIWLTIYGLSESSGDLNYRMLSTYEKKNQSFNMPHPSFLLNRNRQKENSVLQAIVMNLLKGLTCEVAELWDKHGRSRWRPTWWPQSLHVTNQKNLVAICYVQTILLERRQINLVTVKFCN